MRGAMFPQVVGYAGVPKGLIVTLLRLERSKLDFLIEKPGLLLVQENAGLISQRERLRSRGNMRRP